MKAYKVVFPGLIAIKTAVDEEQMIADMFKAMNFAKHKVEDLPDDEKKPSSSLDVYEITDDGDVLVVSFRLDENQEVVMERPGPLH